MRALKGLARTIEIPDTPKQAPKVIDDSGDVGMFFAEGGLVDREGALNGLSRSVELAEVFEHGAQVVEAAGELLMILAEGAFGDVKCALELIACTA